jgi:hypothetical protein
VNVNFNLLERISELVLDYARSRVRALASDAGLRILLAAATHRSGARNRLGRLAPVSVAIDALRATRAQAHDQSVAVRWVLGHANCGEDPFVLLLGFAIGMVPVRLLARVGRVALPPASAMLGLTRAAVFAFYIAVRASLTRTAERAQPDAARAAAAGARPLRLSRKLVAAAVVVLPDCDRDQMLAEWCGELFSMERWGRVRFVVGIFSTLPRLAVILHRSARREAVR